MEIQRCGNEGNNSTYQNNIKESYSELHEIVRRLDGIVDSGERLVNPVRKTLFKRFPIGALFLVAFGVSATSYGIEQIIHEIAWLHERPVMILFLGLGALALTGKLYQKLG